MKLGEWLKQYRKENDLSMQDIADACGFSKAYVGMLEKGINPTTNKPISPTIRTFEKIARLIGQDVDSFLKILDDNPFAINNLSSEEHYLLHIYRGLDSADKNLVFKLISRLAAMVV